MIEETKHTPGPFHVVLSRIGGQDGTCSSYDIINEDGKEIAQVETCNYSDTEWNNWVANRPSRKANADAQFVALTLNTHDDMLAALKAISYKLHCMNWSGELIDNCDTAIAKAEGRAE